MIEAEFRPDRLQEMMDRRKLSAGQLVYLSGVSSPMVSLMLAGKRPNASSVIVAKLARTLRCSMEYLLGIVDTPSPQTLDIGDLLIELTEVARHLPSRRQRDLLLVARAYLQGAQEYQNNPSLVMDDLLDMVAEVGGEVSRERLLAALRDDAAEEMNLPALEQRE